MGIISQAASESSSSKQACCCHGHHPWIQSKLLRDHKGEGNETKSREKRERGEWGIDHMRSNKVRVNGKKGDNTIHKSEGSSSLFQLKQMKE